MLIINDRTEIWTCRVWPLSVSINKMTGKKGKECRTSILKGEWNSGSRRRAFERTFWERESAFIQYKGKSMTYSCHDEASLARVESSVAARIIKRIQLQKLSLGNLTRLYTVAASIKHLRPRHVAKKIERNELRSRRERWGNTYPILSSSEISLFSISSFPILCI